MAKRSDSPELQPAKADVLVTIVVRQLDDADPLEFEAVIQEENSESRHRVTVSRDAVGWLTQGRHTARACVEATLRFLLDHQPRETMGQVNLDEVRRNFPDFEAELHSYYTRS